MKLYPAIDLLGGRLVRLTEGRYDTAEGYGLTPAEAAAEFEKQGAKYLHLVDLDGAKAGHPVNRGVVAEILKNTKLVCEIGGGIRTQENAEDYLRLGAERVILGSAAVDDFALLRRLAARHGSRVVVGVDAKDGKVATHGWLDTAGDSIALCERLAEAGVRTVIYTDISRDGKLSGVNREVYRTLCGIKGLEIVASGGISTADDLRALRETGVAAAIVGKAIYTGTLSLQAALTACGEQ